MLKLKSPSRVSDELNHIQLGAIWIDQTHNWILKFHIQIQNIRNSLACFFCQQPQMESKSCFTFALMQPRSKHQGSWYCQSSSPPGKATDEAKGPGHRSAQQAKTCTWEIYCKYRFCAPEGRWHCSVNSMWLSGSSHVLWAHGEPLATTRSVEFRRPLFLESEPRRATSPCLTAWEMASICWSVASLSWLS